MKQRLLWEADVSELIQELLKRKSDDGESYFQLEKCMKRIENKEDNDNKESRIFIEDQLNDFFYKKFESTGTP